MTLLQKFIKTLFTETYNKVNADDYNPWIVLGTWS